jgi:hypothetical protein
MSADGATHRRSSLTSAGHFVLGFGLGRYLRTEGEAPAREVAVADYSIQGISPGHHHQPGDARRTPSREGGDGMRQVQIKRIVKREPTRSDPLPLDPRDADVVRAKRRLYEREVSSKKRAR